LTFNPKDSYCKYCGLSNLLLFALVADVRWVDDASFFSGFIEFIGGLILFVLAFLLFTHATYRSDLSGI